MYWEEIFCVHFFYQNPFQDVESNIQWLKSNVKKFLLRGPYFGGGGGSGQVGKRPYFSTFLNTSLRQRTKKLEKLAKLANVVKIAEVTKVIK